MTAVAYAFRSARDPTVIAFTLAEAGENLPLSFEPCLAIEQDNRLGAIARDNETTKCIGRRGFALIREGQFGRISYFHDSDAAGLAPGRG
ncbi:MAG: hypothetical protein JO001_27410 [Alphaproteobacteria bacterium]|nr:hypothetical protein [Alphaproteobacteria bacterium]